MDQSLHPRLGAETTNRDGFGMGWYGAGEGPGVYRSVGPAWGDANLRELAAHMSCKALRNQYGTAAARTLPRMSIMYFSV